MRLLTRADAATVFYTFLRVVLLPVVECRCGRSKNAAEEQVRGEIDHKDKKEESDSEVHGSGTVGAMEEGIFYGEIEILVRSDEARGDEDREEDRGLQFPRAAIVA